MATGSISVKLFVDKINNKVVFAECDRKLVDILLSFLTIPIGMIVKLLKISNVGCIDNLRRNAEEIDTCHLSTRACRDMLLHPRNNAASMLQKLEINPDPEATTTYYTCMHGSKADGGKVMVSTFKGVLCTCKSEMVEELYLPQHVGDEEHFVFVNNNAMFMIADDMRICEASTSAAMMLLEEAGVANDSLSLKCSNIEIKQVMSMMYHVLHSRSVLTEVFLIEHEDLDTAAIVPRPVAPESSIFLKSGSLMQIVLYINKKDCKVLYAEVRQNFVDLLFTFLTFPLGSALKLFNGRLPDLGSVQNLYMSAKRLNSVDKVISKDCAQMLLDPKLAPFSNSKDQLIQIEEQVPTMLIRGKPDNEEAKDGNTKKVAVEFVDPKKGRYVESQSNRFMVTDELLITPFSLSSGISHINDTDISMNEIEERVVRNIGKEEALLILKHSLISKTVLTDVFLQAEIRRIHNRKLAMELAKPLEGLGFVYDAFVNCLGGF